MQKTLSKDSSNERRRETLYEKESTDRELTDEENRKILLEIISDMIVRTVGDKGKPAILMIPGMFCTYEMPVIIAEY